MKLDIKNTLTNDKVLTLVEGFKKEDFDITGGDKARYYQSEVSVGVYLKIKEGLINELKKELGDFWVQAFYDMGLISYKHSNEPVKDFYIAHYVKASLKGRKKEAHEAYLEGVKVEAVKEFEGLKDELIDEKLRNINDDIRRSLSRANDSARHYSLNALEQDQLRGWTDKQDESIQDEKEEIANLKAKISELQDVVKVKRNKVLLNWINESDEVKGFDEELVSQMRELAENNRAFPNSFFGG